MKIHPVKRKRQNCQSKRLQFAAGLHTRALQMSGVFSTSSTTQIKQEPIDDDEVVRVKQEQIDEEDAVVKVRLRIEMCVNAVCLRACARTVGRGAIGGEYRIVVQVFVLW